MGPSLRSRTLRTGTRNAVDQTQFQFRSRNNGLTVDVETPTPSRRISQASSSCPTSDCLRALPRRLVPAPASIALAHPARPTRHGLGPSHPAVEGRRRDADRLCRLVGRQTGRARPSPRIEASFEGDFAVINAASDTTQWDTIPKGLHRRFSVA